MNQNMTINNNNTTSIQSINFEEFLPIENIVISSCLRSKRQALSALAERAAAYCGGSHQEILHAFIEREKLGSTALGHKIALPHAQMSCIKLGFAVFLRSKTPVDFDAPDEEGVELFFAILACKGQGSRHLHDLSRIARMLRVEKLRSSLLKTNEAETIWKSLADACSEKGVW